MIGVFSSTTRPAIWMLCGPCFPAMYVIPTALAASARTAVATVILVSRLEFSCFIQALYLLLFLNIEASSHARVYSFWNMMNLLSEQSELANSLDTTTPLVAYLKDSLFVLF